MISLNKENGTKGLYYCTLTIDYVIFKPISVTLCLYKTLITYFVDKNKLTDRKSFEDTHKDTYRLFANHQSVYQVEKALSNFQVVQSTVERKTKLKKTIDSQKNTKK